jgi:hypothetical protein
MGNNRGRLCENLCLRDLCQRHHCVSGIFLLATKAQKHKISQKQEFKMQGFSINQPENLAE